MTTVFNCNQKLSSHQLQVSIEVAQEWHFKSKTSSTHCASWIASDPPAACNIGTQVFACSSVTLWHISVHNQRALIYYTICRCKILPACNTGMLEMAAKICPPKSSQNLFWQIYSSSAIFSARLFYKMRLIRSSQAEFGQTIHLYTTSSRRLGQLMYISASYGVHVNASCNVHELYALVNDRMSSRPRPQSITGTKTRL